MDEKYEKLIKWLCKDEKTFISAKVATKHSTEYGSAVFTRKDLQINEKLISIPLKFNLNFVTILRDIRRYSLDSSPFKVLQGNGIKEDQGAAIPMDASTEVYSRLNYDDLLKLSSFQLLTLYLQLESHRDKSFWKPFIEVLPDLSDFKLSPYTWLFEGDEENFEKLPAHIKTYSRKQFEKAEDDFNVIYKLVSSVSPDHESLLCRNDFRKFWACCNSRCLYFQLPKSLEKTNEDNFTMVPFVDFLNHDIKENCITRIVPEGFQVISSGQSEPEQQLLFSYGPHADEFLLCEYGFMFDRGCNPWNSLDITEQLVSRLSLFPQKIAFLEEWGYWEDYHINNDISYRVEVALAALIENENGFVNSQPPRRLKQFVEGISEGLGYKKQSTVILKEILLEVHNQCEPFLNTNDSNHKDLVIKRLYQNMDDIASYHLQKLSL